MDSGDRPPADDADACDDVAAEEPDHDDCSDESGHDDGSTEAGHDDGSTEAGHDDGSGEPDGDVGESRDEATSTPETDDGQSPTSSRASTPSKSASSASSPSAASTGSSTSTSSKAGRTASTSGATASAAETATETSEDQSTATRRPTASSNGGSPATGGSPDPEPGTAAAEEGAAGPIHRFLTAKRGPLMWIREMLSSAAVVLAIGLVLFAVSGVWPPMVAVESGSMEPNMEKGDLVFVTEPGRFAPDAAGNDAGIVTYQQGVESGYTKFGNPGSVIVYRTPDRVGSPIIHRARFHVEAGENWYDRADKDHLRANNCEQLTNCPAPHAGFITKGDANPQYDQANGIAPPVKAEWVTGVARVRVPYLGWVRLIATGQGTPLGISPGTTLFAAGASALAVGRRSCGAA